MSRSLSILVVIALVVAMANAMSFARKDRFGSVPLPAVESLKAQAIETLWFEQPVDHFNPLNNATFKQRVFINSEFGAKNKAPLFVYIGSEGALSERWVTGGLVYQAAQASGAHLVAIEHRFYGETQPFDTLDTENLRFLSSRQALEDLAQFIAKYAPGTDPSTTVVFGGSYGGSLAAWARLKYPALIAVALASSAPLDPLVDFKSYYVAAERSFTTTEPGCTKRLNEALTAYEAEFHAHPEALAEKFNYCRARTRKPEEKWASMYAVTDRIADIVQYNQLTGSLNMAAVCKILSSAESPIDGLQEVITRWLAARGEKCLRASYDEFIDDVMEKKASASSGMRQWMWQTCTEFGFYQTTGDAFGHDQRVSINLFLLMCEDAYGISTKQLYAASEATRAHYGGTRFLTPGTFFTNGEFDPWAELSILPGMEVENVPTLVTKQTSHCAILGSSTDSTLVQDRQTVIAQIRDWIFGRSYAPELYVEDSAPEVAEAAAAAAVDGEDKPLSPAFLASIGL